MLDFTVRSAQLPWPETGRFCGLDKALSLIVIDPKREPLLFGANFTSILQVCAGAIERPAVQVVVLTMEKSPLEARLPRINGVVPLLVSVTLFTALVVPTFCVPNESEPGLSETRGLMAVAIKAAFCGLPAALSVTTSDAEAGPG